MQTRPGGMSTIRLNELSHRAETIEMHINEQYRLPNNSVKVAPNYGYQLDTENLWNKQESLPP